MTTKTYANTANTVCSQQNFRLCTLKTAGPAGVLTASAAASGTTVTLSTEGTTDWAHWGLVNAASFDHKSGVTSQLSTYSMLGGGTAVRYDDNGDGYTWTGGTPTASASNSTTGVFVIGLTKGFQIVVPADTTSRTVKLYLGGWAVQAKLEATLSDSSAAPYIDTSFNDAGSGTNRAYTLTYQAASANQTLTVTWTITGMHDPQGNASLQAATLVTNSAGGGGGSTTTTYDAVTDFSSTQGAHGWYYLSSTGAQLTWNGSLWQGTDAYIGLGDDWGHPGNSTDAVRRWVAPQAGSIQITGTTYDADTSCGTDGVLVTIKKNGTVLWQQTIAAGNTTGFTFNLANSVVVGNQIDFVINKITTDSCDSTFFSPTIVVTTGGGSSGTVYQDLRYVYGLNGNVNDIYDSTVTGGAGDQHLSYDGLDRLTLANGPYGTNGASASLTYTYDELGNLTFNSQVGAYTYPTSGTSSVRPHAVSTAGSNSYTYDANGNMTAGAAMRQARLANL